MSTAPDSDRRRLRTPIWVGRILVVVVVLACWEFIPRIPALQDFGRIFDPFFVSSPSAVWQKLLDLFSAANGSPLIWPYLWPTVWTSMLGTVIGMIVGAAAGLLVSNSLLLSGIFRPFAVALNAIPRVALVPVIILLFGPTVGASVVIAFLVVVFVAFFNAYEGGTSIPPHLIQNARLMGAGDFEVLMRVRAPFVLAWTMSGLPLAVTFALISVVTAELLTGATGIGKLIQAASTSAQADLTFALVVILTVVGVIIVFGADLVRNRVLHWWGK